VGVAPTAVRPPPKRFKASIRPGHRPRCLTCFPALIEERIAVSLHAEGGCPNGWVFAEHQVHRYEATTYVSIERVQAVADAVGLGITR